MTFCVGGETGKGKGRPRGKLFFHHSIPFRHLMGALCQGGHLPYLHWPAGGCTIANPGRCKSPTHPPRTVPSRLPFDRGFGEAAGRRNLWHPKLWLARTVSTKCRARRSWAAGPGAHHLFMMYLHCVLYTVWTLCYLDHQRGPVRAGGHVRRHPSSLPTSRSSC